MARSGESPDRLVAQIMEQAAEVDRRTSSRRRRRPRGRGLAVLSIVLVALAGWNVWDLTREPEVFSTAEEEMGLQAEIYLAVEQIEAFRRRHGSLPADLASLGLDSPELTYSRESDRYTVAATTNRVHVAYEVGQDLAPYRNALDRLLREEPIGGGS